MIDLITVVFREELSILKLQARSIDQYCQDINLGRIYVIVNDDTVDLTEIDLSWWGSLREQVTVIHRSTWRISYVENGWLTQQLLKLLATELCSSTWSMVLDAKTIFVRQVSKIDLRPKVGLLDIYPVFDVSRQRVNSLFNVQLTHQLGPGGVPFILSNTLTQEMIKEIEILTNESFSKWFQDQGMVTEFILYAGYVLRRYGYYDAIYDTTDVDIKPCNLCHSEVDKFDQKFKEMQGSTTVSIHRRAWNNLTKQQQNQYTEFLSSRGIK
jgi:hypothetical protein